MEKYKLPNIVGEVIYLDKKEVNMLMDEYSDLADFINSFLDYKIIVNRDNEVEAILFLKTFGGPTTWLWFDENNCDCFEDLVNIIRPT